jgi:light-regulated signal transduction histidine kinase (bacteriophytochrome)
LIATSRTAPLGAAYQLAMRDFLSAPSEAALSLAYDLGRRALEQGLGVVDWATVHGDALMGVDRSVLEGEGLARANAFFLESLSPFEMTQRGYAENNRWLERLNHELRAEISEKERLAGQLRESNAELEAFSYSVAHDLRAPLRHIAAFSQILVETHGPAVGDAGKSTIERIQRGVQRMSELIDGLLVLSRVVRAPAASQALDLAPGARAIVERLRELEPGRVVDVQIADEIPAEGDHKLLAVVLENLLGNAWKFTSKKSQARIEVGLDLGQKPPVYFVRDNGAGFDMTRAETLFGVFQRFHTMDAFPGTGIGLATVQRVVRRHGGKIWAEAQPDVGATFYFTLAPDLLSGQ